MKFTEVGTFQINKNYMTSKKNCSLMFLMWIHSVLFK